MTKTANDLYSPHWGSPSLQLTLMNATAAFVEKYKDVIKPATVDAEIGKTLYTDGHLEDGIAKFVVKPD